MLVRPSLVIRGVPDAKRNKCLVTLKFIAFLSRDYILIYSRFPSKSLETLANKGSKTNPV